MLKKRALYIFIILIGLLFSCNDFNKLQKSQDLELKYTRAVEYYQKGDYVKAQLLFDELYAVFRSTAKGEDVMFYLAYCNYKLGDYILAGYQFRLFYRSFPLSQRAEECLYMSAYCHYLNSPPYTLDQQDTYAAIEEFQYFVQSYPNSPRVKECNKLIDDLRAKIEKKKYELVKLYLNIGDYKATIVAVDLLLQEFPASKHREELMFFKFKAKYLLAENSVESKKEDRVNDCIAEYKLFSAAYSISEFSGEAKGYYEKALKLHKKIEEDKKTTTNKK
ncbi:MAG: hypothetical protein Fur0041_18330 [Bacteroidia bacterium]